MPTPTFYNLPEQKRQRLITAIRSELARVPYDSLSINQIIKLAGIPRGSFYQYFPDKADMLDFLLRDYRSRVLQSIDESLEQSGGDMFQMFLDILDFTYAYVTGEKSHAFCKNIFADIRMNMALLRRWAMQGTLQRGTLGELAYALQGRMDSAGLDIRGEDDLANMLGILMPLTGEAFARVFFDLSAYEDVRRQYAARLELLKRGFSKAK